MKVDTDVRGLECRPVQLHPVGPYRAVYKLLDVAHDYLIQTIQAVGKRLPHGNEYCRRFRLFVYEVCQCLRVGGFDHVRVDLPGCAKDTIFRARGIASS